MSVDTVNQRLAEMRAAGKLQDIKAKGAAGEAAALDVLHEYRTKRGGILKQGFMYPYASNRQSQVYLGNIFYDKEQQKFTDMTMQLDDEIDILYISHYRVFAIEVKSYHSNDIVLTNQWMKRNGEMVDKSPLTQAEKHARHLYHQLYEVLPEGDPNYVQPIVVFVDRCHVIDERSPEMQFYLPVVSLDMLLQTIMDKDLPRQYTIDLDMMERRLKAIETERTL